MSLFAVMDGHGGASVSEWVSKNLLRVFRAMLHKEGIALDKPFHSQFNDEEQISLLSKVIVNTIQRLDIEMKTYRCRVEIRVIDARLKKKIQEQKEQKEKDALEAKSHLNKKDDEPSSPSKNKKKNNKKKGKNNTASEANSNSTDDEATPPPSLSLPDIDVDSLPLNTPGTSGDIASPESQGCTMAFAVVIGGGDKPKVLSANVGDSRCLIFTRPHGEEETGEIEELFFDHEPTNEREHKRISEAGGFVQGGRVDGELNLSRALGDHRLKQAFHLPWYKQRISALPDIKVSYLTDASVFMLIGCDGLWELHDQQVLCDEVNKKLAEGAELSDITEALCDIACVPPGRSFGGMGMDNITSMVVHFGDVNQRKKNLPSKKTEGIQAPFYSFGSRNVDGIPPDTTGKLGPPNLKKEWF